MYHSTHDQIACSGGSIVSEKSAFASMYSKAETKFEKHTNLVRKSHATMTMHMKTAMVIGFIILAVAVLVFSFWQHIVLSIHIIGLERGRSERIPQYDIRDQVLTTKPVTGAQQEFDVISFVHPLTNAKTEVKDSFVRIVNDDKSILLTKGTDYLTWFQVPQKSLAEFNLANYFDSNYDLYTAALNAKPRAVSLFSNLEKKQLHLALLILKSIVGPVSEGSVKSFGTEGIHGYHFIQQDVNEEPRNMVVFFTNNGDHVYELITEGLTADEIDEILASIQTK